MKKHIITVLLLCTLAVYVQAQSQEQPASPLYRRDIGFNTNIVFNGIFNSGSTPFTLMYKTYRREHRATRYALNLNTNLQHGKQTNGYLGSGINTSVLVGTEYQHELNKRWIWFHGIDFGGRYQSNTQEIYWLGNITQKQSNESYGVQVRPFLAIRYQLAERLYLAAEASFNVAYDWVHEKTEYPNSPESNTKNDKRQLTTGLSPASGIFVFYRF